MIEVIVAEGRAQLSVDGLNKEEAKRCLHVDEAIPVVEDVLESIIFPVVVVGENEQNQTLALFLGVNRYSVIGQNRYPLKHLYDYCKKKSPIKGSHYQSISFPAQKKERGFVYCQDSVVCKQDIGREGQKRFNSFMTVKPFCVNRSG